MRINWRLSAAIFLAPLFAFAQAGTGTIHGTIYGTEDENESADVQFDYEAANATHSKRSLPCGSPF